MNILNKQKLQQNPLNYLSYMDLRDFMNLNKECTTIPYSFSLIDDTLASNSASYFRNNEQKKIKTNHENWR